MDVREYEYQIRPLIPIVFLTMALSFLGLFGYRALARDTGLPFGEVVLMSPESAVLFWWALVAIALGFVLYSAHLLYGSLTQKRVVRVSDHEITQPREPLSRKMVTIPFADITRLVRRGYSKEQALVIDYKGGKAILNKSCFSKPEAYDEIANRLADEYRKRHPE